MRDPLPESNASKGFVLLRRLREQLLLRHGHVVVLLCDEAQRLSKHGLEWLRDVHDQLAQQGYRLITFLVGQPELLAQKAHLRGRRCQVPGQLRLQPLPRGFRADFHRVLLPLGLDVSVRPSHLEIPALAVKDRVHVWMNRPPILGHD